MLKFLVTDTFIGLFVAALIATAVLVFAGTSPAQGHDGNPGFIGAKTVANGQPIHADPVFEAPCTTAPAMLVYLHAEPNAQPSAGVFAILKGEQATALLMLTGGAQLATGDRIIYMFHAPQSKDRVTRFSAYAMMADSSGCIIRSDGSRTTMPGQPYAGVTLALARACDIFAAIGVDWFRCKDGRPVKDEA